MILNTSVTALAGGTNCNALHVMRDTISYQCTVRVCVCISSIYAAYLLTTFAIMFLYLTVQHVMVLVAWAPGKFILYPYDTINISRLLLYRLYLL